MATPALGYLPRWAMGTRHLDAVANRKLVRYHVPHARPLPPRCT